MHAVIHQSYMDQHMMDILCTAYIVTHQSHMDVHNVNPTKPKLFSITLQLWFWQLQVFTIYTYIYISSIYYLYILYILIAAKKEDKDQVSSRSSEFLKQYYGLECKH